MHLHSLVPPHRHHHLESSLRRPPTAAHPRHPQTPTPVPPQLVTWTPILSTGESSDLFQTVQRGANIFCRAAYGYDVNSPEFKAWQAQQQQQYAQYYAQQGYGAAGQDGAAAPPPSDPAPPPPPPT